MITARSPLGVPRTPFDRRSSLEFRREKKARYGGHASALLRKALGACILAILAVAAASCFDHSRTAGHAHATPKFGQVAPLVEFGESHERLAFSGSCAPTAPHPRYDTARPQAPTIPLPEGSVQAVTQAWPPVAPPLLAPERGRHIGRVTLVITSRLRI